MNISIFGLGYVGCVGAACCAKLGHRVIGNDVSENKVKLINQGRPTIIEAEIDELVKEAHDKGLLEATMDYHYAVHNSEISFIVVGTPSSKEGHLNLNYIYGVARQIGEAMRDKSEFHIIAIRSTVLPGTNKKVGEIIAEASGKERGKDFTVVSNPEFLREGTAVKDYMNPPLTLIGTDSEIAEAKFRELYKDIPGEFISTDIEVAEIMKYVNNTYHSLKIVFANEVGNICKALGIDSHKVMEIFCKDKQLNISPYYFKPGFAYGGSCLPKDSKALRTLAHDLYVDVPVINAINPSNEQQKKNAVEIIESKGKRKIGILGLSFKSGTDDLRCSPIVDVAETLLGKGYEIHIYDKNVRVSQLTGTNADFIAAKIPHLHEIITDDMDEVANACEVLVITNKEKEFADIPERYPHKMIVDLVRQFRELDYEGNYEGISWGNINVNPQQDVAIERTMVKTEF
ncbi:nucleotide sugar dehydrogenase [Clostridium transplantifaecale]|uniref:nucleotide sugar dehydrogenase n=1 Tax=Clostridium transplantifaecale TaxID=2479838 RepID=UPI000F642C86|nr:UDP-glucose/GDP-mannose dehydrogenase family protein [Clostridium transplantifaecale]